MSILSPREREGQERSNLLKAALDYLARGWCVIPIAKGTKRPLIPWEPCQHQRPTEDEVRGWWARWPEAQVAVVTGAVSSLVVLDEDGPEGQESLKGKLLPATPTVRTGRGLHRYFEYPGFWCKNFTRRLPGLDFRGDGGYVLAPPSLHPSGCRYQWADGLSPDDVPLAPCPDWLLELLRPSFAREVESDGDPIQEGERNSTLTSLAGTMRRRGMSQEAIEAALLAENLRRCVPPLPENEVKAIARSVARYTPAPAEPKSAAGADLEGRPKDSQASRLVKIGHEAELWHSPEREAYATVIVDAHRENLLLGSKAFRRWLARRFYQAEGRAPGSQALQDALTVLEGDALFGGAEYPVYVRLAPAGDRLYLDLADEQWRAVEISSEGWRVVQDPPVRFRRPRGILSLPQPARGGSLELLRQYLNPSLDDEAWVLLVGWLVGSLHPAGPYPILILQGEQGSGKSLTARVLRALIDPNVAPLRTIPREERDLMIAARNGWVVAYDNLSGLPAWLSDAICRLSTGGGFGTRELFQDVEEILIDAKRPVIINGIDELADRDDLRDRAIIITLPPIPEHERREEGDLWQAFEADHLYILGALLDAVSVALREVSSVRLGRLPRMADFARWVVAAETALPWPVGTFIEAYAVNRQAAAEAGLTDNPLAQAIMAAAQAGGWRGTATELLQRLSQEVDEHIRRTKAWPASPRALSNRLRRLASTLRTVGVEVDFVREAHGRRAVLLRTMVQNSVTNVTESPEALGRNDSQGDATGDAKRPATLETSPERHPQNACGGRVGDNGDEGDVSLQPYSNNYEWVGRCVW
ncbi:MAG: bifunctional DNA primase/polymerase [Bacillota bacterium]